MSLPGQELLEIAPESPAWFAWLDHISSFAFWGKSGHYTARKESGLPVKQVAKVLDFMGNEFTQETTFADYKEFQGIKKAMKIENKRAGEKFLEQQTTSFKVLDKVDPKTFTKPE